MYARVELMHGSQPHKTRRTYQHSISSEILFNESFNFTLPCRLLEACGVRVTLVMPHASHQGALADEDYGRVTLGSYLYARGDQSAHWKEMIDNTKNAFDKFTK